MGKRRISLDALAIPMSSMIDVTFLLLIYFLITKRDDIPEAHLAVNLPSQKAQPTQNEEKPNLLEIEIHPGQLYLKKTPQTLAELEAMLARLSAYDPDQTVIIKTSPQAQTQELVQVLDLCKGLNLTQLNVMTLK
jgi:biopolymer transport protein ExbD